MNSNTTSRVKQKILVIILLLAPMFYTTAIPLDLQKFMKISEIET